MYHNPTRLHFGKDAMDALAMELAELGQTIQLMYGGGSIKQNGICDQVIAALWWQRALAGAACAAKCTWGRRARGGAWRAI